MRLRTTTRERAGVTFVSIVVTNDEPGPKRYRVANRVDGPVWPPRVHGTIAAGWDEAGYEGVLAADATQPLGYATNGAPVDPPAELVWTEPAGESEPEGANPDAILRSFGDPRPPADVVVPQYLDPEDSETGFGDRA